MSLFPDISRSKHVAFSMDLVCSWGTEYAAFHAEVAEAMGHLNNPRNKYTHNGNPENVS